MSEVALKRTLAVLGALLATWLVVLAAGGGASDEGEGGAMAAFVDALDPVALDAIAFEGGGDPAVRLERPDRTGAWLVGGHRADSARVAGLLAELDDATVGRPVAINPVNHARMEIDEASARLMVLDASGSTDSLLLGKRGPSYGSIYARLAGQSSVYVLDADLVAHAGRGAEEWRSRVVATLDTTAVAAVEVARDGSSYHLARGDSAWSIDGEAADPAAVRALLGELAALRASGFPAAGVVLGVADGERRSVTVRDAEGSELLSVRMWRGGEEDADFTAVAEGPQALQPDAPFTFPSWRADDLAPPASEVRAEGDG